MKVDGTLIRRIRRESLHESLGAFAERVGVDKGALSRVERGIRTTASYNWLHKIAVGLGVPVEAIAHYEAA